MKTSSLEPTTDFKKVSDMDVIVICVPTPVTESHLPNLGPVRLSAKSIAPYIKPGQLIVLESTVNPGVCEEFILPILEEGSGMKAGKDFYLAHSPERINPGDDKWNVENTPRVVGSLEERGLEKALAFYRSILTSEIKAMKSLKEAEAVKVVENSFRDVNIAFVNELAMSFSHLGIDVVNVIEGASTKPFSFLPHYPGCGVGGHCIPVDPYYLIDHAQKNGFNHEFLKLAREINNYMPAFTVKLVIEALREKGFDPKKSVVAVLGLSYKADIDDTRESPAFEIIDCLREDGISVNTYDPFVVRLSTHTSLKDALEGAQAAVLATAHSEFKAMTPEDFKKHEIEIVVDGRNVFSKEEFIKAGIIYKGIGR